MNQSYQVALNFVNELHITLITKLLRLWVKALKWCKGSKVIKIPLSAI